MATDINLRRLTDVRIETVRCKGSVWLRLFAVDDRGEWTEIQLWAAEGNMPPVDLTILERKEEAA